MSTREVSGPTEDADKNSNQIPGNAHAETAGSGHLSRRRLLERGGTAAGAIAELGLAGFVGFKLPHYSALAATRPAAKAKASPPASAYDPSAVVRHFETRTDLTPPAISVTSVGSGTPATSPGYILAISPTGPSRRHGAAARQASRRWSPALTQPGALSCT